MDTKKTVTKIEKTAPELISEQIANLNDWRGKQYAQIRQIILDTDPDITEEWKWGTAVWSHNGLVCSAAAFKDHIRLNFFKGAAIKDRKNLFNVGLDANVSRGIAIYQGDTINKADLQELILAAEAVNSSQGNHK